MQDIKGKVAVVTGGASGIGRGICRALAAEGANVVVADIDEGPAGELAEELRGTGIESAGIATDVRSNESVEALAEAVSARHGGVDILCNNAGVYLSSEIADVTEDDWRFVMSVNLDGVFRVGQRFAKLLREQGRGGHIVNTASVGGFLSGGGAVAYTASKFGVVAYSEALRADLASQGIGVSTLCPGPIVTNLITSDRFHDGEQKGGKSQPLWDFIKDGLPSDDVGPIVVDGIRRNAAYIFTHDYSEPFRERFDAVMDGFDALR